MMMKFVSKTFWMVWIQIIWKKLVARFWFYNRHIVWYLSAIWFNQFVWNIPGQLPCDFIFSPLYCSLNIIGQIKYWFRHVIFVEGAQVCTLVALVEVEWQPTFLSSNHFILAVTRPLMPESHPINFSQSQDSFRPNFWKLDKNSPRMVPLIGGGCIANDGCWVAQRCNQLSKTLCLWKIDSR